jgi:hypothetical protein
MVPTSRSAALVLATLIAAASACGAPATPAPGAPLETRGVRCPFDRTGASSNLSPRPAERGVVYDLPVPRRYTGAHVVHAGDLELPSGRLVTGSGGDMAFPLERRPVDLGVAGGSYPVNLLIATFDDGDRRVAFAELVVRDTPIVRWEGSTDLSFTTDGGDAGYISPEASAYAATGDGRWLFEAIDRAAALPRFPPCEHVTFADRPPLDVLMFQTGWGDGAYPTALGYDAEGRPSAVVTFTFVIPWRLAGLPGRPPQQVLDEERRRAG